MNINTTKKNHFGTMLFDYENFPKTRFTGSKRKLLGFLADIFSDLEFNTVLDPFCGTGCVSYLLKCLGKQVTASDILQSNIVSARALIENQSVLLKNDLCDLTKDLPNIKLEPGFIEKTFEGIFFETQENRFIDQLLFKIKNLNGYQSDLALHVLFQACLAKRPYNLFHRANLYMRQSKVKRSFGNKKTWDTPFSVHIKKFAAQADKAIFNSKTNCTAMCLPANEIANTNYDLVYLDPPYISQKGLGVDYLDFYHFLEGLCFYDDWKDKILHRYKHKPIIGKGQNPFSKKEKIAKHFEQTIKRFSRSTIVISYRSDGIPSIAEIVKLLKNVGKQVEIKDAGKYTYALSQNKQSSEVAIIGK